MTAKFVLALLAIFAFFGASGVVMAKFEPPFSIHVR